MKDVVFLHGWGLTAGVWTDVGAALAARFRVRALDLPGYGAAPTCAPYALDNLARAAVHAAPPRCSVVGWSLGGQVALAWALRAPLQVERLVLIATTPCFTRRTDWDCALAPEVLRDFGLALAADAAGTLRRFAGLQAQGDAHARQVTAALSRCLPDRRWCAAGVLEGGLAILRDADLRAALHGIAQPALVLQGGRDRLVPLPAGRHLAAALRHGCLKVLPDCAHAPLVSQPETVARALAGFFDG